MRLKSHGAFRTGSNYLKALLELNYDVDVVNSGVGFKHMPVPAIVAGREFVPPEDPILGSVKDPWSWLPSMWRYVSGRGAQNVSCGATWTEFLRQPITVTHGGHPGFPRYRFASPVDYWNAMAANLGSLDRAIVVRYEDVLEDPQAATGRVAERFDIASRPGPFIDVPQRTVNMADRHRTRLEQYVTPETFDRRYYDERLYLAAFSRRDQRTVSSQLDDALTRQLGY
jgi:hypothetical protein